MRRIWYVRVGFVHLNVVQPWSKVINAFLAMSDIPDSKVERARGEKALVSHVVLLL